MRFDSILLHAAAALAMVACVSGCARDAATESRAEQASADVSGAATPASAATASAAVKGDAVATFAGGCFWCIETQFEGVPGVRSVISGYTGGTKKNPTYEEVGAGNTGHYESVQIRFDPKRISYAQLLERFWYGIDPTQSNGQFCDRGEPYRSAIFYHDAEQRRLAESTRRAIEASGVLEKPIVTEILPASVFYPAEEYHQDFWKKDPVRYRTYRLGCGRDRRLTELWGDRAVKPSVH